jgi:dephospho-CoA kinase
MRYLITGVAGTGKSTVAAELSKRGYAAFDADAGFSYYVEKSTGKRCDHPQTPSLEWYAQHERVFDEAVLEHIFADYEGEPLFLASITANQSKYYDRFDKIFLLSADDQTIATRLKMRTNSDFGKHPVDMHRVLSGKADFDESVKKAGAVVIDSTQPLEKVVGQILSHVDDNR